MKPVHISRLVWDAYSDLESFVAAGGTPIGCRRSDDSNHVLFIDGSEFRISSSGVIFTPATEYLVGRPLLSERVGLVADFDGDRFHGLPSRLVEIDQRWESQTTVYRYPDASEIRVSDGFVEVLRLNTEGQLVIDEVSSTGQSDPHYRQVVAEMTSSLIEHIINEGLYSALMECVPDQSTPFDVRETVTEHLIELHGANCVFFPSWLIDWSVVGLFFLGQVSRAQLVSWVLGDDKQVWATRYRGLELGSLANRYGHEVQWLRVDWELGGFETVDRSTRCDRIRYGFPDGSALLIFEEFWDIESSTSFGLTEHEECFGSFDWGSIA